ncbi:Succinyl-CoA synthetase, alpha subunit-related enzymes [Streptococcus criceti]|nr:CoA-binding protein [Streptococcus criceti]SUN43843.1 Succinyl-CoA synthetase, alpha subunit-related enzymes [Streptococcus criceti]
MTYHFTNPNDDTIKSYLQRAKTIAVVGLSDRTETAAYKVAKVMQEAGYQIMPVNPRLAGQEILGQTVYASLQDISVHIDIVDVFRRSEFLIDVAHDFVQADADVFWSQLGLEAEDAEAFLRQAGCEKIVMNRCIKIEYGRLIA